MQGAARKQSGAGQVTDTEFRFEVRGFESPPLHLSQQPLHRASGLQGLEK